jgi:hypothetical protein
MTDGMTDDLRRAYAIFDLDPSATIHEVRQSYYDLVKVWHPDRFHGEPERLRRRVEAKLKEITAAYDRLRRLAEAAGSGDPIPMDFGARWGFVNEAGDTVIHPEYDAARGFRNGLAAVCNVGKWGFIDGTGAFRVTPLYEECGDFAEGLAAVKWYGRWGYVDATGAFAVQPRFQQAGMFSDGWARVRLGARWGRISRNGEIVFDGSARRERIEDAVSG